MVPELWREGAEWRGRRRTTLLHSGREHMLGSTVLFAALQLTATIRHARRDERPQWARRELNPPQLACRDAPPCKLVAIRARRFLLLFRALTEQTAGKKSQTRPVLRPGRTSGRSSGRTPCSRALYGTPDRWFGKLLLQAATSSSTSAYPP